MPSFIRLSSILILMTVSALSAFLTFDFMWTLGSSSGLPEIMAAIGVALDAAKVVTPFAAIILWQQGRRIIAVFVVLLATALTITSFTASTFAVEQGVLSSWRSSAEYKAADERIEQLQKQIVNLESLAASQQAVQHLTKAAETIDKIAPLRQELDALIEQQADIVPDTLLAQYGKWIMFGAAAIIELVGLGMALIISFCSPIAQARDPALVVAPVEEPEPEKMVEPFIIEKPEPEPMPEPAFPPAVEPLAVPDPEPVVEEVAFQEQPLSTEDCPIKAAILSGEIKPSHRGITTAFPGTGRPVIKQVLVELEQDGLIEPEGRGYKLVA